MASEHLALPGSSNVVALSYAGDNDNLRRARLVRELQCRETADRMERTQSQDVDASSWANEHRRKVRGRHGRRDTGPDHRFIEEVREAAREQKEAYSDWVEETEPEQEQEQEQEPPRATQIKRRDHGHDLGPLHVSARGNRGQLGRRNSRGSRYKHVGRRRAQRLINLEIPVLVRSLKSSNVELG